MDSGIVPTYVWHWRFNVIVAIIINLIDEVLLHVNIVKYFFSPVTKIKLVLYFYFT